LHKEDAVEVEREVQVPAAPRDVWAALTESDQLSAWFGAVAEKNPDGSIFFRWDDGTVRRAVIEVGVPERLLVLRWLPFEEDAFGRVKQRPVTKVVFTLTPAVGGTRVKVVETKLGFLQSGAPTMVGPSMVGTS
jgi:uncharacterized protein YndB with AHSA1/START domain